MSESMSLAQVLAPLYHCDSVQARYAALLALSRQAPKLDVKWQQDAFLVSGCEAKVWIGYENGLFVGGSEARLLQAIVHVLCLAANECIDINELQVNELLDSLELGHFISASRTNGLKAVEQRLKTWVK
jgi:cysteine desulfuration protein SufE